ncbi:DUF4190 domain-containing protein [Bacillus sp. FJAT-49736]|uniref:DUF4190 domain-containing protein n=1 Tax=Bacillus sp. FJAT-49736 TaxID=2833582 RepID=UPI001BC9900A|nr:DUF4190 domain-containing protein [Bacillus sp. FJAT-49736]MBS4175228.1 DUF4190 domain-containing protein [Bacillus sp. FJAT-49736]
MDIQKNNNENQQNTTSGSSITALVLGILSLVIPYVGLILGIVGIVFSKKAFREIEQYKYNGKGMAVAGLVTSIVGCAIYGIIILILIIIGIFAGVSSNF